MTNSIQHSKTDTGLTSVNLADLIQPKANQIRKALIAGTVTRYADTMRAADSAGVEDSFPPIQVRMIPRADGRGTVPELIVGFHRVAAARRAGRTWLMAEVVEATDEEARWISAQSNLTHGEPLKAMEHREVFRAYVRAGRCFHRSKQGKATRPKSSREIAADLHGLRSHTTIVKWMRQDFRAIWKQMGGEVVAAPSKNEPNHGERRLEEALEHLTQVEVIAKTLSDPHHRGQVLAALTRAGKALEEVGPCEPFEEEF